ncbi:hypothetical protein M2272_000726 [Mycobacterium frederiksbergense]|uniref:HEAT repeat domain-containing protein n=1 Tax=Mycolicibacterium frederiksbergense TaxID=117567 RepID=A0ABT6KW76_9MYCO|nr:hypothetical protein [Mycolicibacterium frederiksbergense]MDH6194105.1 hypothetical protein [Mycolicibacterium frederiksbergense]
MTDRQQQELEGWRATIMSDLEGADITAATRALLALTYDDPDRRGVELVLLRQLSSLGVDQQVRALAVTCMGHIGRLHRAVSPDVVRRLEELLDDPDLGGQAEDALGDISAFVAK